MPSKKQKLILNYLSKNDTISILVASELIGYDIYRNECKYVSIILSNMVKKGYLKRKQRGIYILKHKKPQKQKKTDLKNQLTLF